MCGGVQYNDDNKEITTYFPHPKAMLPIMKRDGSVMFLPWGRRQNQPGDLPLGGWARLESIEKGLWDKYHPKSVKIPLKRFMEKDHQDVSHWFDVTRGQYIQGLVARYDDEYRVYVVTITPERLNAVHERWPRIISAIQKSS